MSVESPTILQRMSLFSDSKALATAIRTESKSYLCSEAAEHIEGLWQYSGELATEIKRLRTLVKENASINQPQTKTISVSVAADTSAKNPEYNQEFWLPQSEKPTMVSNLQRLAMIQSCQNHQVQEKPTCSQGDDLCHHKKTEPSDACTVPQYEYLTLALPMNPNHSVQIYGHVKNTPLQFLPLAELLLTMLRDLATRVANDEQRALRDQFDILSCAAIALVNAMGSPEVKHHSKEEGH